ncbi:hypothetical protein HZH68_017176 [Vespula germanica]|uniref:Uncharacterized protein n=1 Tax=Vespula germanica TaxID=30212 RepID=A0A834MP24_VESGE|nr:hypothetical protein HZH68_017176 [Vespula germanica]
MKDKKFIIFSDLDGTLLHDDHKFSDKTIEVVNKLYDNGIYFVPATARTLKDLKQKAAMLGIDKKGGIIAASNGAQIYDFKTDSFIVNKYLPKELIEEIFERYYNKFFAKLNFYSTDSSYVFAEGKNNEVDEPVTHLYIVTNHKATDEEKLNEYNYLKEKYSDRYKVDSYHNNRVFDISTKGLDKGNIVKEVKKYLNLGDDVHSYGFGDGHNDIPLLKACDTGVAMKNGFEDIKAQADDVTEFTNAQDGVARYIIDKIIKED